MYEIVVTVLTEQIAELSKDRIEARTGYHCEIREKDNTIDEEREILLREIGIAQRRVEELNQLKCNTMVRGSE